MSEEVAAACMYTWYLVGTRLRAVRMVPEWDESWRLSMSQEYEASGTGAETGSERPSLPSYDAMTGVYPGNRGHGREVPTDAGVENPLR